MVSKQTMWGRILGTVKVFFFAVFMYTLFSFLSPILSTVLNNEPESKPGIQVQRINPLEGHWLKTEEDKVTGKKNPSSPEVQVEEQPINLKKGLTKQETPLIPEQSPVQEQSEVDISHNNKGLNNTEVIFYWTEGQKLKALTIMSLNQQSKRGGVVALPLHTRVLDSGEVTTLADVFKTKGREAVTGLLERQLEIKVESYVDIDQNTFETLSEMMGPIDIKGESITIAEAFEQTRIGQRKDDTAVVRAVATRIIRPDMLIKIPRMIWILSSEIETNLGPGEIMTIYKITQNTEVETMTKVALPGENYVENGKRYREVHEYVWKNILWELTH